MCLSSKVEINKRLAKCTSLKDRSAALRCFLLLWIAGLECLQEALHCRHSGTANVEGKGRIQLFCAAVEARRKRRGLADEATEEQNKAFA